MSNPYRILGLGLYVAGTILPPISYFILNRCLGSPIASIVAAISSEALGKPIRIKEESFSEGKSRITLEVLS